MSRDVGGSDRTTGFVSIAIVTRGLTDEVTRLTSRLLDLARPTAPCEVLVVAEDPGVSEPAPREALAEGGSVVRIPRARGLAYNRNRAVEACEGEVIVFVDDDCWPHDTWFAELLEPLGDDSVDAVMGNVRIPPSTFLGDSISALGFPGGGTAGFGVMFRVDEDGTTDHLSTLNCALRRRVFDRVGGFDETMTAGSEDTELSHRIRDAGMRMLFQPTAVVDHRPRTSLTEFARWFFRRGRGAYQLSRRVPAGPVIANRLASYRKIIRMHRTDPRLVAIIPLLIASVALQEAGFAWEWAFGSDRGHRSQG